MLTEAGCTAIRTDSYFYLLADKQTCSLFLKVSIRTQTKPSTLGEHDAQPSFPKTQAKPRTGRAIFCGTGCNSTLTPVPAGQFSA